MRLTIHTLLPLLNPLLKDCEAGGGGIAACSGRGDGGGLLSRDEGGGASAARGDRPTRAKSGSEGRRALGRPGLRPPAHHGHQPGVGPGRHRRRQAPQWRRRRRSKSRRSQPCDCYCWWCCGSYYFSVVALAASRCRCRCSIFIFFVPEAAAPAVVIGSAAWLSLWHQQLGGAPWAMPWAWAVGGVGVGDGRGGGRGRGDGGGGDCTAAATPSSRRCGSVFFFLVAYSGLVTNGPFTVPFPHFRPFPISLS
jgi:hypothetical protein